ncbi:ubiquitin C-terminal hydrolase 12-like [Apium graveolens]|uniref:ubiquitin C-terminal hydrolase 12-like n=1 Tax=Apium graveolens TaxID=4045 RepID=UPI003D7A8CF8
MRLILDTFSSAENGYLIDDSCVFSVEVYKVIYNGKGEIFKMIKDPKEVCFNWKIPKFSKIWKDRFESEVFTAVDGEYKWRFVLNFDGNIKSKSLCLDLKLVASPPTVKRVLADFSLVVKNQKYNHHCSWSGGDTLFSTTDLDSDLVGKVWGTDELILLSKLKRESQGFILNNTSSVSF